MSVRIHQLAKEIGMENKELLELLQSRGFVVKSVSSTIDNISAESLIEEYKAKASAEAPAAEEAAPVAEEDAPKGPVFPEGVIVKSAEDLEREKQEAAAAAEAEKTAAIEAAKQAQAAKQAEAQTAAAAKATPPAAKTPPAPATPPPAAPPRAAPPKAAPPKAGPPPAAPQSPLSGKPPVAPPPAAVPPKAPAATPPAATPPAATPPAANRPPAPAGPPVPPPAGPPKPPAATPPAPAADAAAEPSEAGEAAPAAEPQTIHIKPPIVVRDFAGEIGLKPFKLISELMEMGIFASMNQTIEEDTAQTLATRHGFLLEIHHRGEDQQPAKKVVEKVDDDDPKFLKPRPPVVCILGHVDHGKTTLLDTIRKANVTAGEAGGITQHIGAYQIEHSGQKITFIDTPGHAAFSMMRARGANVTDIAVLVIAADDAFKPQTEEALKFARQANNAIVVAINKIDAKGANIDRVKQQMQEKGIAPEDWGGETVTVGVSALNGTHIDELLDMILLQAEVMELQANPSCPASGIIVESQIEQGRGPTASVIVEKGTLKKGDALLCGESYCRVKSLLDENGKILKSAPPATPVKVLGWSSAPSSGDRFTTEKNEKSAKRAAEEITYQRKREANAKLEEANKESGGPTIDDLFAAIESKQKKCLKVIVKSDVHGSAEALANALTEIESDKVDLDIISVGVGNITKNDVTLASTGSACIVGFNVKLDNGVQSVAKHHDVRIIQHEIIYELLDQVEEEMVGMLDAELSEKKLGAAEVRQVFPTGKGRFVAGCMVTEGTINRNKIARLVRGGEVIHESTIDTLKRFKDDVKEVRAGYECGINVEGFNAYEEGDVIECFAVEEIRPSLR
ncbi:MAG: translation initiation factor IF-2 [Coraliomargarita sp.]